MKRLQVSRWFSVALLLMVCLASAFPGARSTFATPADGLCKGNWGGNHAVADFFDRDPWGRLFWSFKLEPAFLNEFGSSVTVKMPYAYVNGIPINPPYPNKGPQVNTYNWHASMLNYQHLGSSKTGTIKTGDILNFNWTIEGNGNFARKNVTCTVPAPF